MSKYNFIATPAFTSLLSEISKNANVGRMSTDDFVAKNVTIAVSGSNAGGSVENTPKNTIISSVSTGDVDCEQGPMTDFEILRESFDSDVDRLVEYKNSFHGLLSENIITEDEIEEGFFDTLGSFAKNAGKNISSAWKKAKVSGDKEEMKRLEKRMAELKAKSSSNKPSSVNKKTSSSNPKSTTKSSGTSGLSTKKPATQPKSKQNDSAKKVIVKKTLKNVVDQIKKNDPKQFKTLANLAKSNPKKLEALLKNPKIQKAKDLVQSGLAKVKSMDPTQPGFVGKVATWSKKNPVKAVAGLGLIAATGAVAAIGAGGLVPLLAASLLGAAKGAVIGGAIGGGIGAAKSAISDKRAGNKFDIKKTASAGWSGAKKGMKKGAVAGAAGAFIGNAVNGISQFAGGGTGGIGGSALSADQLQQVNTGAQREANSILNKMREAGFGGGKVDSLQGFNPQSVSDLNSPGNHFIKNGLENLFPGNADIRYDTLLSQKAAGQISDTEFVNTLTKWASAAK